MSIPKVSHSSPAMACEVRTSWPRLTSETSNVISDAMAELPIKNITASKTAQFNFSDFMEPPE